ncbi:hypothetical protein ALC57_11771 [Trachymyrmex cornetzi]|uniref:Uncharacterized protein n=1 Tax=Trachymyrmex cornetzi TaxID=471704 RepID=A0A151K3F8_9HYME|nr:hypothetical protein ALC57_11771 [Trachymyrmex cornetzi]
MIQISRDQVNGIKLKDLDNTATLVNLTDNMEGDLIEEAIQLNIRKEYVAWEQRCDELIEFLKERSRTKRPRLAVGLRQSVVARIARLESLKDSVRRRLVHVSTFESRIVTGAGINSNHIEPRQFLEDAGNVLLERVRDAVKRHGSVKMNIAFNGDFAMKDKRTKKSIITKNSEIYTTWAEKSWDFSIGGATRK